MPAEGPAVSVAVPAPTEIRLSNGAVAWVQIDVDAAAADDDHLISPEERLRLALARQ